MTPIAPTAAGWTGFRRDINALRALAVAAVMAYHISLPGLGGGYVGVDVFFVISGFLMTGIVCDELTHGAFSYLRFIAGRARRIVPALVVMCAATLVLGWRLLGAQEYRALAIESIASLSFISNFLFWGQAGYFDIASHDKWLLHTWSLSVEAQFYLLFPLTLAAVWRAAGGNRISLVAAACTIAALSLVSALVFANLNPIDGFYLLPARIWEFLAGGLAWIGSRYRPETSEGRRRACECIGIASIIGSAVFIEDGRAWPDWPTLVPVLGTILVLVAARQRSLFARAPALQWMGSRSYSLYLWHWPAVVLLSFGQWQGNHGAVAIAFACVFAVSEASYRWIETPLRGAGSIRPLRLGRIVALMAVIVAASVWILAYQGFPDRLPQAAFAAAAEVNNRYPKPAQCFQHETNPGSDCRYGEGPLGAILIGDSHANALATALAEAARAHGASIRVWEYGACPWLLSAQRVPGLLRSGQHCAEFNRWALQAMATVRPDVPVVLVSRTSAYAMGPNEAWETGNGRPQVHYGRVPVTPDPDFLGAFTQDLARSACRVQARRPVFLVRPIPEMGVDVPRAVSRAIASGRDRFPSISLSDYAVRHRVVREGQNLAASRCGVRILDPVPFLCTAGRCPSTASGRPLYYDDNHLSEFGNRRLVPMFSTVFPKPKINERPRPAQ